MRCGQHRLWGFCIFFVVWASSAATFGQHREYISPFVNRPSTEYRPFGTSSFTKASPSSFTAPSSLDSFVPISAHGNYEYVRLAQQPVQNYSSNDNFRSVVTPVTQSLQQTSDLRSIIDPPSLAQREDSRDDLITGQIASPAKKQVNAEGANGTSHRQTATSPDLDPNTAPFTLRNNGTYSALPSYGGTRSTTTFSNSDSRANSAGGQETQESKPWAISATQTVDYVKNLALPINLLSNNTVIFQNDWQYQTSAQAQYRIWSDKETSLVAYSSYYQSIHPEVTQQDLNVFSGGLVLSHKFNDSMLAALSYDYSYYYLDQASLFSANRLSPSIQLRATKCVDYQLSYSVADSNYRTDSLQTSIADFVQIQRISYFDEEHLNYWFVGYQFGFNDAELDSFAYKVRSCYLGTRLVLDSCKRYDLFSTISYGNYDYQGFDVLEPLVIRDDDILTASTKLTRTFGEHCSIFALYTFTSSNSTVMRQTYNSELYSVGVSLTW